MATITSANAIIMLSVPAVFPSPFQLQGFGPDTVYDMDVIESTEASMGVDGILSGGFVFAPIVQPITFQADSPSLPNFDTWYAYMFQTKDTTTATATISLPGIGTKYSFSKGFLTRYSPMPPGGRILRPRVMTITWQSALQSPIGGV